MFQTGSRYGMSPVALPCGPGVLVAPGPAPHAGLTLRIRLPFLAPPHLRLRALCAPGSLAPSGALRRLRTRTVLNLVIFPETHPCALPCRVLLASHSTPQDSRVRVDTDPFVWRHSAPRGLPALEPWAAPRAGLGPPTPLFRCHVGWGLRSVPASSFPDASVIPRPGFRAGTFPLLVSAPETPAACTWCVCAWEGQREGQSQGERETEGQGERQRQEETDEETGRDRDKKQSKKQTQRQRERDGDQERQTVQERDAETETQRDREGVAFLLGCSGRRPRSD